MLYLVNCEKYREDIKLFDQDGVLNSIFIAQKRDLYSELWVPGTRELRSIQNKYRWMQTSMDEDTQGNMAPSWVTKLMEELISRNIENYPIYWESGRFDSIFVNRLHPNGLIFRVSETNDPELSEKFLRKHDLFWDGQRSRLLRDERFLSDTDATKAYSFSLSYMGNFFRKMGLFHKAAGYYRDSIRISPNSPQTFNNLGYCYLYMGRLDEAEIEFLTLLDLFGYYESAHVNLGVVYGRRGEYEKARREWEIALGKNPNSALAKENLSKLRENSEK